MKNKKVIKYVGIFLVVLIVLVCLRSVFVGVKQDNYNNSGAEFQDVLLGGNVIEQQLVVQDGINALSFIVKNSGNSAETILLEFWDWNHTICYLKEELVIFASRGEESILTWNLEQIDLDHVSEIAVVLDGQECSEMISICVQNDTAGQVYLYNGQAETWHLRMSVLYEKICYWSFFFTFCIVVLLGIGIYIYAVEKALSVEKLFIIVAISCGIAIAIVNPFGQEPDGWIHFLRTVDVSYGNITAPWFNNAHESGYNRLPANINDLAFKVIEPSAGEGWSYLQNLIKMKFSEETILVPGDTAYTSLYYLPQALGTLLGRTLGMNIYLCMILARVFNLLGYVVLTYWALKLMPLYKNLFAVIALLPMTIYQAASYSPDALLMGICFLFTAICFYYAFGEKEILTWRNVIILGVLLALMFTCKYIYVCLGLLAFLIPKRKFGSTLNYWKSFGIAVLPFILVMVVCFLLGAGGAEIATENELVVGPAQMTQFEYVKAHPLVLVKALVKSLITYFDMYVQYLNTLGWLNYPLKVFQPIIPCFMVGIACLDTEGIKKSIKTSHKVLCFFTGCITVAVSMIGLYLMDNIANPVGAGIILGYQTRYAIPCLVLLLMVFGSKKVENRIPRFSLKVLGCMEVFLIGTILLLVRICY